MSKADPVAAIPSPYPANTPHPTPQLHFVRSDCAAVTKRAASVHLDGQRGPVTAVMSRGQCVLHYSDSSASLFKKVLEATGTPRR